MSSNNEDVLLLLYISCLARPATLKMCCGCVVVVYQLFRVSSNNEDVLFVFCSGQ